MLNLYTEQLPKSAEITRFTRLSTFNATKKILNLAINYYPKYKIHITTWKIISLQLLLVLQIALDDSNIQVILRKRTTEEQAKNRLALTTAVFDCVRLNGKQGIAIRDHADEKKNKTPLEFTVVGRPLQ